MMLKKVHIDTKPDGKKIFIPLDVTHENIEQQVKIFIEMADDSRFDGQLHISHFRQYHGKSATVEILKRILSELHHPNIELDIQDQRKEFIPFFEAQLSRHSHLEDQEFGKPGDRSQLPL